MLALDVETKTFKVKFHPFISTAEVPYDKSFRRELRYFARMQVHEKHSLSCFASAENGDKFFSLFANNQKYADCSMGEESILKIKMHNLTGSNGRCMQCSDFSRWTSSSSLPIFDVDTNRMLLLDATGKAVTCRFVALLLIEWIVETMNDKSLHQKKKDLVMSIYKVESGKKIDMLRIRRNRYWKIEHFDETFQAALTGFLM
jgi:hypothetical protein